jgi:hypothetical protein
MHSFLTSLIETLYEIAKAWLARRSDSYYKDDPVLPSELDDWDAEFNRLTGKSIWEARCEADPNLRKSAMMPRTARNNPNPFYGLQNQEQIDRVATQLHMQRLLSQQQGSGPTWDQLGQQGNQHNYQVLLGGLGYPDGWS